MRHYTTFSYTFLHYVIALQPNCYNVPSFPPRYSTACALWACRAPPWEWLGASSTLFWSHCRRLSVNGRRQQISNKIGQFTLTNQISMFVWKPNANEKKKLPRDGTRVAKCHRYDNQPTKNLVLVLGIGKHRIFCAQFINLPKI